MNTIPTISNEGWKAMLPSYTAVGGAQRAASTGLSLVLLNREGRYPRRTLFQELERIGFDYIISVEGEQERYDLEDLCNRFPFVRFILIKEKITIGEEINLAAAELSSPSFFVFWNDYSLLSGITAARMAESFVGKRLCTAPVVQNSQYETLHTLMTPVLYKEKARRRETVRVLPEIPVRDEQCTLYPCDWLGIYDREKFLRLGGFDRDIESPYWQLMDFGFRSWLWGEECRSSHNVRLIYDGAPPSIDSADAPSYRLFYLKNLAPEWRADHAHLPLRYFPRYLAGKGWDIPGAWAEFSRGRKWVINNKNRFQKAARTVIDLWEHGSDTVDGADTGSDLNAVDLSAACVSTDGISADAPVGIPVDGSTGSGEEQ
jgi:hypothetical protein